MNRTRIYNFLSLVLVGAFILGSMICMNFILQIREKQLLSESGNIAMESPVRAWQWENGGEETDIEYDSERYLLTNGQMEDAIRCWSDRTGETIHDPVEGQVSMERAIRNGEKWLLDMGFEEGNGKDVDMALHSVTASLSVGERKESAEGQLEPYYSFWTVQFSSKTMSAVLYLNAVSGQVWSAEITLYENLPEKLPHEKLNLFVELAGLRAFEPNFIEKNLEGTKAIIMVRDSFLYAQMEYCKININDNAIVDYSNTGMFRDNYAIITYNLMIRQK